MICSSSVCPSGPGSYFISMTKKTNNKKTQPKTNDDLHNNSLCHI